MTQKSIVKALGELQAGYSGNAMQILREALAQTQEPKIGCVNHDCDKCKAQRTWVGLTDEDKHKIELRAGITEDDDGYIVSQVFKLIEAKLKELNT